MHAHTTRTQENKYVTASLIESVTSWRGQKTVVSVVSCRLSNSITTTCCQKLPTSPSTGKLWGNVC